MKWCSRCIGIRYCCCAGRCRTTTPKRVGATLCTALAHSCCAWLFAAADGVEYEDHGGHNSATFRLPNGDGDAACTVCQRPAHQQTYVQWGRSSSCSNGHTTEYTGLVMASHYTQTKSEFVCVDRARAVHSRSSGANENGGLLYFTEMERGAADEVYPENREVGCSVCSVRAGTGSVCTPAVPDPLAPPEAPSSGSTLERRCHRWHTL